MSGIRTRCEAELVEIADRARRERVPARCGTATPAEPERLMQYSRERVGEIAERSDRRSAFSPAREMVSGLVTGGLPPL